MCLQALLIEGLSPDEKTLLINKRRGEGFGTGSARIAIINSLMRQGLVQRMGYDPVYGRPSWVLTPCGRRAANLLVELDENPLLRAEIRDGYDREVVNCPFRSNPFQKYLSYKRNPSPDEIITEAFELLQTGYFEYYSSLEELTIFQQHINANIEGAIKIRIQNFFKKYDDIVSQINWTRQDVRELYFILDVILTSKIPAAISSGLLDYRGLIWINVTYLNEFLLHLESTDVELTEIIESGEAYPSEEYYEAIRSLNPEFKRHIFNAFDELLDISESLSKLFYYTEFTATKNSFELGETFRY
jgi:hypothetical protein